MIKRYEFFPLKHVDKLPDSFVYRFDRISKVCFHLVANSHHRCIAVRLIPYKTAERIQLKPEMFFSKQGLKVFHGKPVLEFRDQ